MNAHAACQLCNAKARSALDFLQYPHLRTRSTASIFNLLEVVTHASVDHPELLEDDQRELRFGSHVSIHDFERLRWLEMAIILHINVN